MSVFGRLRPFILGPPIRIAPPAPTGTRFLSVTYRNAQQKPRTIEDMKFVASSEIQLRKQKKDATVKLAIDEAERVVRHFREQYLIETAFTMLKKAYPGGLSTRQIATPISLEHYIDPRYNSSLRERIRKLLRVARSKKLLETLNKPNRVHDHNTRRLDAESKPFIVRLTRLGRAVAQKGEYGTMHWLENVKREDYGELPEELPPPEDQVVPEAYYKYNKGHVSKEELERLKSAEALREEDGTASREEGGRAAAGRLEKKTRKGGPKDKKDLWEAERIVYKESKRKGMRRTGQEKGRG